MGPSRMSTGMGPDSASRPRLYQEPASADPCPEKPARSVAATDRDFAGAVGANLANLT